MTHRIHLTTIAIVVAGLVSVPAFAQSGEAAQVIFTNDKLTVIDAKGVERAVRQGDFVQPGERLITPPGVIGQLRLPDGTLLGARPGSDLKLETIVGNLGKNVLVLNEGNIRVLNIEPPKGPKPKPAEIISPISKLQISDGDGAAIHVKPGDKRSGVEPGTYNHLQRGTAIVRNEKGELPLQPLQPVFAGKPEILPAPIATLPASLVKLEPIVLPTAAVPAKVGAGPLPELKTPSGITLAPLPLAGAATMLPQDPIKPAIGTAPLVGTGNVAISNSLTPMLSNVDPVLIRTATLLKPPLPVPPPPVKLTSPNVPVSTPVTLTSAAGTFIYVPTALRPIVPTAPSLVAPTVTTAPILFKCLGCTTFTLIK